MKKIISSLICLLTVLISGTSILNAGMVKYPGPPVCHSFLGIQFIGTIIETRGSSSPGPNGGSYYSSSVESDCTNADTKYYIFLVAIFIFSILSGIGYSNYRKYKSNNLITQSNIKP